MYYSSEVRTNTEYLSRSVPRKKELPQDVVDRYHSLIKKSFEEFGISFDVYSAPLHRRINNWLSDFFKTLYNKGEFIEKHPEQYYDEEAKHSCRPLYHRRMSLTAIRKAPTWRPMRKVRNPFTYRLINPKSAISGSKPVMKETKHWYLPSTNTKHGCAKWILEDHKEWRPNVYGQCKAGRHGLQPRAVSRDLDWGIPFP